MVQSYLLSGLDSQEPQHQIASPNHSRLGIPIHSAAGYLIQRAASVDMYIILLSCYNRILLWPNIQMAHARKPLERKKDQISRHQTNNNASVHDAREQCQRSDVQLPPAEPISQGSGGQTLQFRILAGSAQPEPGMASGTTARFDANQQSRPNDGAAWCGGPNPPVIVMEKWDDCP